jgi:glycosyltransferase involved in cell wall biosynthesis
MAESDLIKPEVKEKLKEFEKADILVGIPSFNNSRTISHVANAVSVGLSKYFPDENCILVNSDGGSQDATTDVFQKSDTGDLTTLLVEHPVLPIHKIATGYVGQPGKGSAFRTIFKIADELKVKACAVVDSDLRSITPEWIELLIEPIYKMDYDYVSPLYSRHKYDGTITNGIIYPLTRALYGKKIRQPIGGDFGFSGRLASHYLTKNVWDTDVARFGIDIWMTTTAIADGFKVCQSYLGAKIHDTKDPGADLSNMFVQVLGSVFELMEQYFPIWSKDLHDGDVPLFGFKYTVGLEPIKVNVERMIDKYKQGVKDLMPIWKQILSEETCKRLEKLSRSSMRRFRFRDELWVKVIYEYCISYHGKVMTNEHLMKSMIPLYLGRTASFVIENEESTADEVEQKIESLCQAFESTKPFIIESWQKGKV